MTEMKLGRVSHCWCRIGVAGIEITTGELRVGGTIRFKGHTIDITRTVDSMEVEEDAITVARADDSVGMKGGDYSRDHDEVLKVT